MIAALLLSLFLSADEIPARYPAWKNHCWLSSPVLSTIEEVVEYMDNNVSDGVKSNIVPTYSGGVKWYVVYQELSLMPKCLAKAKKK